MGTLFGLAICLVVATVVAALITGQRLGQRRQTVFQLERTAEDLRRRVADLEDDRKRMAGHRRALVRLRREKREAAEELGQELDVLRAEDGKQIGVRRGLRPRTLEPVAA